MEVKIQKIVLPLLLCLSLSAFAQGGSAPADSMVRLISAQSVQLIEKDGLTLRKALEATFLHNGTYLISDEAVWNVDTKMINATGNVRVIQDETILTSDALDYDIDASLAMFRGSLVQLQDRDRNTLRTNYLDYNTKDSTAVFSRGGSFRDKDGQIIESIDGTYNSEKKLFDFKGEVNMFTDSVFIRTARIEYSTPTSRAVFPEKVDFWKDGYMLSSNRGVYTRQDETFFFYDGVHALSERQESWSDSLYYYRNPNNILLLGEAQLQDTTRHIAALADYIFYEDSLSRVTMEKRAAVVLETREESKTDTLYFGADSFEYTARRMCDISDAEKNTAKSRLDELFTDPVGEYRTKAAKEAAEAAAKAAEDNPNIPKGPARGPSRKSDKPGKGPEAAIPAAPAADAIPAPAVADSVVAPADSLKAAADTLVVPDTTRVGFLLARGSVKGFRQDIQIACDSMRYCDLDSIARFYIDPVIWNEGNRQYSSDSLFILVRESRMDRASLMSNAFILTQEDSLLFDQIKGTEVMAYFDTTSRLRRFDALGGASTIFFLREHDALATVNKVETKMMSGTFVEGQIDRVYYFDAPKNDAYPVVQLPRSEQRLKGFNWQPERRPASKDDITTLTLRPSERSAYEAHPRATFHITDKYFPGYIASVYRSIEVRDSLARIPKPAKTEDSLQRREFAKDSLMVASDSLGAAVDSLAAKDSLSAVSDSLKVASDSLGVSAPDSLAAPLTKKQILEKQRAEKRAAREAREKARLEKKEARWAELDARDAARAEAKKAKALERKRARTLRLLKAKQKQDAADAAKLKKYIEKYEKQRAKKHS